MLPGFVTGAHARTTGVLLPGFVTGAHARTTGVLLPPFLMAEGVGPDAFIPGEGSEARLTASRPLLLAGFNGAFLTAPRPLLSTAGGFANLIAPRPTLVSTVVGAASSLLTAPVPRLTAVLRSGGNLTVVGSAPAPRLVAALLTGETVSFTGVAPPPRLFSSADMALLRAPVPSLSTTLLSGAVLGVVAKAPRPFLAAVLQNPAIIIVAGAVPVPRLSSRLLAGNIVSARLVARAPLLVSSSLTGNTLSAALRAVAPIMRAAGYGAYTLSFGATAPAPHVTAALHAALAEVYQGWVLNTRKGALTEYSGFDFNSFAVFKGVVLAAGPGGVVVLAAQDVDNATAITGCVRTGESDFNSSFHKRVPRLYLDGAASGDLRFKTITAEGSTRTYQLVTNRINGPQQRRIPVGTGPRSRLWKFEVENVGGSDFTVSSVLAYPVHLRRRVS
ncbi:MAG: hypothetical protein DDT20_00679 [Firmicutes bacterium]|nr:hypothetical protein [Bacillota bacterium]